MKNFRKGFIKIVLALAIIIGAVYIGKEAAPLIKLGLDLAGGVSITYQSATDNPTSEQMGDAVYKLQLKAQDYSSEAEVYQEGFDKINIDIPGVSDANEILKELGEPGNLYFIEGELTYPLLATPSEASLATGSNANRATSSNATVSSSSVASMANNIQAEGVNIIQHADGTMTIGGDLNDLKEGDTVVQRAEDSQSQYDYTAKPSWNDDQVVLTGNDVVSARGGMYQDNLKQTTYAVDLTFSPEGTEKFAEATERNLQLPIYIVYNGNVVSAPTVQTTIRDGRAQITGMESLETAERLASTIRIGALPIELKELRSNVVGAKLGQEAITTSLKAGIIGLILVCIFMIIIYRLPGLAASLALTMYTGLMLFLLHSFEVTLTLPGIAGIILSIGMAVDANVIIFARIREEIGAGKSVQVAVKEGFNKALSAILDGNITTLIASAVLFFKGTGSIKGFAATLALGIVLSMFTALVVTKFLLNTFLNLGIDQEILYGSIKPRTSFKFTKIRKITYAISIIAIVLGLVFMAKNKVATGDMFDYGLDFKGGSSTNVTFNEDLSISDIEEKIVPIFENVTKSAVQTQKVQGTNEVIIKTRTLTLEERTEIDNTLQEEFSVSEENIKTENISGAVSVQMRQDAIVAVIIAIILMLIYIWFRFKDIRFASSAVIALIHDCLVTIGCYAILKWTVDSTFIACMLTILGYSINATIVIFDRIRENLGKMRGMDLEEIVNSSITQTFTRSLNTSITTFIMVFVLYLLGVTSIRLFAMPLMVGIIAGGFSSICLTGCIWFDMKRRQNMNTVQNTTKDTKTINQNFGKNKKNNK